MADGFQQLPKGFVIEQPGYNALPSGFQIEDQPGMVSNIARGIGERGSELAGNLMGFAATTGANLEKDYPIGGLVWEDSIIPSYKSGKEWAEWKQREGSKNILRAGQETLTDVDFGYRPDFTWQGVKDAEGVWDTAKQVAGFSLEQGLVSIPDMVALVTQMPAYLASRAEEIGQDRAKNQGRENPNAEDMAYGAAASAAVSALDRFGLEKMLAPFKGSGKAFQKVATAVGTEGVTEGIQEGIEYAAGTAGTKEGFDRNVMLDLMAAGAVGGAGFGGIVGGTGAAVSAIRGDTEQVTEPPTQEPQKETAENIIKGRWDEGKLVYDPSQEFPEITDAPQTSTTKPKKAPQSDEFPDINVEQPAYHGSPHFFDQFKTDKIGTGEGAQAYGYGLYFAENPKVAGIYQNKLSDVTFTYKGEDYVDKDFFTQLEKKLPRHEADAVKYYVLANENIDLAKILYDNHVKGVDKNKFNKAIESVADNFNIKSEGNLYEVDIPDTAIDNMLDWDAPLSEQPGGIKDALKPFIEKMQKMSPEYTPDNITGEGLYQIIRDYRGGSKAASEMFQKAGIPGIKYYDAGSRGKGKGTRNLVVFDDSLVTITHRNGEPLNQADIATLASQDRRGTTEGVKSPDNDYRKGDEKQNLPMRESLLADLTETETLKGGSVLLKSINAQAMKQGDVDIVGKVIESPEDLATLAQIWRDPRWETMRYVFVKEGKVVGHSGFSQRLPGQASLFNVDTEQGVSWLQQKMDSHGADGYWMVHNHPSGDPNPSKADSKATTFLNDKVKGLKGHVVIDHNRFAHIKTDGKHEVISKEFRPGVDWLRPGPSGFLAPRFGNRTMGNASEAASMARQLANGQNIQLAGVSPDGKVSAITEFAPDVVENTQDFKDTIKGFAQRNGVVDVVLLNAPDFLNHEFFVEGYLRDVINREGNSQSVSQAVPNKEAFFGIPPSSYGIEVREGTKDTRSPFEQKYAGNVNKTKFRQPGTPSILQKAYDENQQRFKTETRGKVSWAQTESLAQDLGMSVEDLKKRRQGKAFNAEELDRARGLVEQSAQKVMDAVRSGNRELVLKAMAEQVEIQAKYSGAVAEAGRALQILRKQTLQLKEVNRIANDVFRGDPDAAMEMLLEFEHTGQVSKFTRDVFKPGAGDVLLEIWYNALLSGLQTHVVNTSSNALVQAFSLVEDTIASGAGMFRKSDRVTLRDVLARGQGMIKGAVDGSKLGWRAFLTEEPQDASTKIETDRRAIRAETFGLNPHAASGKLVNQTGKLIRIPGRALMAMDEFYKGMASQGVIAQLATRQALAKGFKGKALAEEINRLKNNPTEEMVEKAKEVAAYTTFTNQLGPLGQSVQNMLAKNKYLRILVPFIRTPTNIVKFAAHRSPVALLMKEQRDTMLGKNGKVARDTALARMALGTSIGYFVAQLAIEGLITGGGPDDKTKKSMLYAEGWQPYSVKIDGKWYSYQRLEPFGMLFGVSADFVEIQDQISAGEADNIAALIAGSVTKNLTSKTWLRGISEFINMVSEPERYGERYVQKLLSTVVPTGVATVARTQDPVLRETRTILDAIKARIPGQSEELYPRRDLFGQPITRENPSMWNPIYESTPMSDPVAREVRELGVTWGKPSRKVEGVELTDEQYDQYQQLAGKYASNLLNAVVRSAGYQTQPPWVRRKQIETIIRETREQARLNLIMQNPDILRTSARQKPEEMY